MQGIGTLITALVNQAQQYILPALILLAVSIGGYLWLTNDRRGSKDWIVAAAIGAAIVFGAPALRDFIVSSVSVHA